MLARYLRCEAAGFDRSNRAPLAVGRGFLLGTRSPRSTAASRTSHFYGHAGAFATVAFADPERELAAAIVTNGNGSRGALLRRFMPLCGGAAKGVSEALAGDGSLIGSC